MELGDAFRELNLEPGVDWPEIRASYRSLMMRLHPDKGGAAEVAARANEAYRALGRAYREGRLSHQVVQPAGLNSRVQPDDRLPAATLVEDLAHCAEVVGFLTAFDVDAGLVERLVGNARTGRLIAEIGGMTPEGLAVSFELEPLGSLPCPAIHDVVGLLMRELRRQRQYGFLDPTEDDQSLR